MQTKTPILVAPFVILNGVFEVKDPYPVTFENLLGINPINMI